jgi:CrcB protein
MTFTEIRTIATVGSGAALGGIARLLITQWTVARFGAANAPLATLGINGSGSFLIGIVIAVTLSRQEISPLWRFFLATGILGGYTTFSTFSYEALQFFVTGFPSNALAYIFGSMILGIGAAALGVACAQPFIAR